MMGGVADGGKGLVLVVEDERPIADLVRMYLTRDGFGVHVEYDGTAGLAAARKVRPVACVLDIALPGMDGPDVCRRLREHGDCTPVTLLTPPDHQLDRVVGPQLDAAPGRLQRRWRTSRRWRCRWHRPDRRRPHASRSGSPGPSRCGRSSPPARRRWSPCW